MSKERENKHLPSHKDLKKQLFGRANSMQVSPQNNLFRNKTEDSMNQGPDLNLFSLDELPGRNISGMEDQLALNLSKINETSQKNNLRIIRQFEHKLNKQKEVNRDLRVEKDMYTLKLEEAEKRIEELGIT